MKEQLIAAFNEYFQAIREKDNERTIECIYPGMFDHFSKTMMLNALNKAKADTSTTIEVDDAEITHVSEMMEIEEINYALLKYTFKMLVIPHIKGKETDGITPDRLIYEGLADRYGMKNVKFITERQGFEITTHNELYAIKDPGAEWKFLEKKERLSTLVAKIIPTEALNTLK